MLNVLFRRCCRRLGNSQHGPRQAMRKRSDAHIEEVAATVISVGLSSSLRVHIFVLAPRCLRLMLPREALRRRTLPAILVVIRTGSPGMRGQIIVTPFVIVPPVIFVRLSAVHVAIVSAPLIVPAAMVPGAEVTVFVETTVSAPTAVPIGARGLRATSRWV
jgi:hypothetical protein